MADGEIRIKVSVDGKEMDTTITGLDKMQASGKKAASGIKDVATALGLVKVASAAIHVLSSSLDGAIKRFDTIERYPKVMESLGYGAEESKKSVDELSKGIEGLPTTLDSVVASAQKMTTITGQLDKSTDAVIALNNSFMANGASVSDADRGMTQYLQMLSKGTVDMMSWRTLQETMGVALRKTAEAMGYQGSSAVNQLYAALQSGKTTFAEFQNSLIGIATGTGEIAKLAQENSAGIATSFTNLKTAVTRNLADLVKVFDDMSKAITGKTISQNINGMKDVINASFKTIKSVVEGATPIFKGFAEVIKATIPVVKALSPVLLGVATAYAGFKIIGKVNGLVQKSNALISTARKSGEALTVTTKLFTSATAKKTLAESADVTATEAQMAVQAAQNGTVGLGTAVIGLFTGATKIHELATIAATAATNAFNAALSFIASPIGLVVTAVGALAAILGISKMTTDKATDSTAGLDAATKRLIETTEKDTKKSQDNADARKKAIEDIDANTEAYNALADELDGLMKKEHKSTADKARMQAITESLNGSLEGLGIAYDKERDSLSMGNYQLKARIKAMQASTKLQEAQKNLAPITDELLKSEKHLTDLKKDRAKAEKENAKAEQEMLSGHVTMNNKKAEALDKVNAEIDAETKHYADLQAQSKSTNDSIVESQAIVDEAVANGVMGQVSSYENLSAAQKEAVDSMNSKWQEYQEQATNMFDVLSDKQTMSVDEMAANLEENQRVMGQWADNMATLASRGVDQGVLDKLRDLGPKGAGYVAALVDATPAQLDRLNTAFKNGGTVATDTLKTSLKGAFDFESSGLSSQIMDFATQTKDSLGTQLSAAFSSAGKDAASKAAEAVTTSVGELADSASQTVATAFSALGENIPEGVAAGVDNNAKVMGGSVGDMATLAMDTFKALLGIHSPSTIFTDYGKNIIEGLKNGVSTNKGLALAAMRELATALPHTFDGLSSQFVQIGSYLMEGLAQGIRDNTGAAVAAAKAAADKVKAVTQHTYDENSPSKWMKDFVGKYLMYGLADGLEKYVGYPVKAMARVSEAVKMPAVTAEMALGSGYAGYRVYNNSTANYYNKSSDNTAILAAMRGLSNRPIVVSIETDGNNIARAIATPMENQLNRNKALKNMLKGVRNY